MNKIAKDFVEYVNNGMPKNNKAAAQEQTKASFNLTKDRSVYYCDAFAVRFCYSKDGSFSNVVLSLSTLQKYDNIPFFVVLVIGNQDNVLYLANSSLLSKISHSSQKLRTDNIRGSFLGSNIIKDYGGIPNDAAHVEQLFAIHQGFTWDENLSRLVEATSGIKPMKEKFNPDDAQKKNLFESVIRAKNFVASKEFEILKQDLDERVNRNRLSILIASHIENINIRGRLIEYLITSGDNNILKDLKDLESKLPVYDTRNGLGDYVRRFEKSNTYTDVKTKVMYLHSNPKAFNVDKFLETMSEDDSVFLFYFVGIDERGIGSCALCSVYDKRLIDATIFQFHWAGRGTRGVAQFNGSAISEILLLEKFENNIVDTDCKTFIENMLGR